MKKAIFAVLTIVAISHYQNLLFSLEDAADRKAAVGVEKDVSSAASASYDVQGLNELVARVSLSTKQKQADALPKLWHITEADLNSEIDIYGERRK